MVFNILNQVQLPSNNDLRSEKKESNVEEKYDDVDEPLKKKAKSTSSHIEQLSKKKDKKYQFNVK